jgi:hypothetical protein
MKPNLKLITNVKLVSPISTHLVLYVINVLMLLVTPVLLLEKSVLNVKTLPVTFTMIPKPENVKHVLPTVKLAPQLKTNVILV